jgi:acyl carrier protein
VLLSGEALLPADVGRWMESHGDRTQLINLYGPTETTMTKFFYFVQPADKDRRLIPIGKPMEGSRALVVSPKGEACPPGKIGEIFIRTPFRSLGYYGQPALTSEVFVPNPFNNDPNDLVYKTGDLGRVSDDGNFEFLVSKDHQVKIRGVRVELVEIENLLRRHELIRDVVVVAREDTDGNKFLCAYVVLDQPVETVELKSFLSDLLPESMVPSAFVVMDALPRTFSGKVDRKLLPAPGHARSSSRSFLAPRTPVETELAAIWSNVLGIPEIGIRDNFFESGGHSLLATQLMARIRTAFGIDPPLRTLFNKPTVEGLSLVITQMQLEQENQQELEHLISEIAHLSAEELQGALNEEMPEFVSEEPK